MKEKKISYLDNNLFYVHDIINKDFKYTNEFIDNNNFTYSFRDDETVLAFDIKKNEALSKLYEDNYYVVKFYLKNIKLLHDKKQEEKFIEMINNLEEKINKNKGYYNLRIPTHVIDLLRAINFVFKGNMIFCGGTVEEFIFEKKVDCSTQEGLKIFEANQEYIDKNKERLMNITYESFKFYQGQYHISNVTSEKAGIIYENWIKNSFNINNENKIMIAEIDSVPIGYITFYENEKSIEGILASVDENYRKYGAYKNLTAAIINYAYDNHKCYVSSTQFDNFIVQGVWSKFGLKPFYSIYNIHIDSRGNK